MKNPDLSMRKPEGQQIQIFEQILKKELFDSNGLRRMPHENIFSIDETGISVNQKQHKLWQKRKEKCFSHTECCLLRGLIARHFPTKKIQI
jgi:hypothetical protein